jgi:DME family drug/metabolite transporter
VIGVLAALTTSLLWALTAMLVKVEAPRLSVVAINFYRVMVATVAFVGIFILTRDPADLARVPVRTIAILAVAVILAMVLATTLNFQAILRIGLARAFPISGAFPLGTLVLSALWLDEGIGWRQGLGGVVTLGGVMLVAIGAPGGPVTAAGRRADQQGVIMAVGAAVLWALSSVVTKVGISELDLLTASVIRLPVAALALVPFLARSRTPLPWQLSGRSWLVLLAAGLLGPGLSSYLWLIGLQQIGAARTDIITATSPIFAVLLAAGVLKERLTRRVAAGTLLSVLGIMLIV